MIADVSVLDALLIGLAGGAAFAVATFLMSKILR